MNDCLPVPGKFHVAQCPPGLSTLPYDRVKLAVFEEVTEAQEDHRFAYIMTRSKDNSSF